MTSLLTPALDVLDDRVKLTAALSTHFDPLGVLGTESLLADDRVESIDALATVCEEIEVPGSDHLHWSMRPEARQRVLRAMINRPGFKPLLGSIAVSPDDMFARYLRDGLQGADLNAQIPPDAAPPGPGAPADLDSLLRAVRLLQDLPGVRTESADLDQRVRRRIAVADAEGALQAVTPPRLVGRERDYEALLEYSRTVLATDQEWVPSFVLVGPGGVGKSALVSTFVLDQRRQAAAAPLIYLDFDRATLIEATSLDLTHEFARQLALLEPGLDQSLTEFRERSRSLLGGQENLNIEITGGASSAALRDLGSILSRWPRRMEPVTVVLDTFEEVAIRGVTPVREVLRWVADLRTKVGLPQVHLVVCGREVIPDAPHLDAEDLTAMFNNFEDPLQLADLDRDKAAELLVELGVEPGLAVRFPPVFGGNPLVLKLLQRFVTTNDAGEVEELLADGEKARGDAPAGELGLRFVYERILNRIRKPRVKALAYPGVVLRRVTPELILEVLAPTCGGRLDVSTLAEADEVFEELAGHVWLVNRIAPKVVVHRADLRRLLVPGLERSADVDTKAIHRAAATYYAARPGSVTADVAEIEEIYHRSFLDDISDDLPKEKAKNVLLRLGGDVVYWPVHSRAMVKSRAGLDDQLTEEEVASLGTAQQRATRSARLEKQLASSDIASAEFEEAQLEMLVDDDDDEHAAIPDSRWKLLFDRGDFEFMTESSRVLSAFDRYFASDPFPGFSSFPTHEHPWFIALAILMVERGARPVFSESALAAIDSDRQDVLRYGAALAALAGDHDAHARILDQVRHDIPPKLELTSVDDVIVFQAAASRGDLDDHATTFQTFSLDHFRLSHLVAIARAAGEKAVADRVARKMARYARERPGTTELSRLRETLASAYVELGGARELRAAPTTLSFLYGVVRTVVGSLDRRSLLDVVSELEGRSVFWPVELTAGALDPTLSATITSSELTALIETADRCGLIVDVIDLASAKSSSLLSRQLASGIREIESLLFPFAASRGGVPKPSEARQRPTTPLAQPLSQPKRQGGPMDTLTRLKARNREVRRRDAMLDDELAAGAGAEGPALELPADELQIETIVMRTGRPVLAIKRDEAQLTFDDPDSVVWQSRLTAARANLVQAARAVGRIEVEGHRLAWLGTGWLVGPETIVTNRHVAAEFGRQSDTRFVFRQGLDGQAMRASIDLLEEIDREESMSFALREILHIEDPDGPDLAFLRVDPIGGEAPPTPIALARTSQPDDFVAIIGYPARDSRIPEVDLMDRIFGDVYDKKRLAPGQVLEPVSGTMRHDCTTLGGNSGSVVLSLGTGEAVGLHFAGRFLEANFAVSSSVVAQRLDDLRSGRAVRRTQPPSPPPASEVPPAERASAKLTYLVPLSITVEIGDPQQAGGAGDRTAGRVVGVGSGTLAGEEGEIFVETVPEDYVDREGYLEAFLGEDLVVPLPTITRAPDDVLTFTFNGSEEQVLKYEHFSVLMSTSRRLCLFSAVNIDGNLDLAHSFPRPGWRTDPRIPAGAQIRDDCYGDAPRFSRGHMTRREDPIWGSEAAAARGNADSMHVTNAVPQMQPFNAGIWLRLEEYALDNARQDDMKIAVFTGPFLEEGDPTMFGVRIPVEFWKVIAFVHDQTGELCATGYTMSQRDFLRQDEFVFGAHQTAQVSISSIEPRAGLSFGQLAGLDPFVAPEGITPQLTDESQIQFLRTR